MAFAAAPKDERVRDDARATNQLKVERILQPDEVTCGPTCLRKVYAFYGDIVGMPAVLGALDRNEDGGTLAVFLAIAALKAAGRSALLICPAPSIS